MMSGAYVSNTTDITTYYYCYYYLLLLLLLLITTIISTITTTIVIATITPTTTITTITITTIVIITIIVVPFRNTQPCRVKPAFKQVPIYNLTVCMEGSTSSECISRSVPVLSSKAAYFTCSPNSGTRHMQWDWYYVRDLIGKPYTTL